MSNGISFERPSQRKGENGITETLIDLSLQDKPTSSRKHHHCNGILKSTNLILPGNIQGPPPRGNAYLSSNPNHRITQSNEEKNGIKVQEKPVLNIFESPKGRSENRRPPRPRRNSDSSMIDAKDDERRKRDRERRRREGRGKDGKPRPPRKPQGMDIIDQLDVTGLYGPGMIHHDGPFDACNPHRNKKTARTAPMQAFPEGSLNNVLGGSGPVNKSANYDSFHGHTVQGFSDYNDTTQPDTIEPRHPKKGSRGQVDDDRPWNFSAKEKIAPVHGEASAGLGTSTFFEGTPASQRDIERDMVRRESEEQPLNPGGGLSRKRSIAQKIRGMSRGRPNISDRQGSVTSPTGRNVYSPNAPEYIGVQSAGGRGRMYEKNPFFEREGQVKDSVTTSVAPVAGSSYVGANRPRTASSPKGYRDRAPSSPRHDLYRVQTQEDEFGMPIKEPGQSGGSSGFIGRVKSLRSKKRPERFAIGGAAV